MTAQYNIIWICSVLCGLFELITSLPSIDSKNDYLIETQAELDKFLARELREYTVRLETAAVEVQENHHRSYDTPYQRKRRNTDQTFPHSFTYDTGVGNREALKLIGVTPYQTFDLQSANDWEYFYQDGSHVLVLASTTVGESSLFVFSDATGKFEKSLSFSLDTGMIDVESYTIGVNKYSETDVRYMAAVNTNGQVTIYQIMDDLTLNEVQTIDDGITKHVESFTIDSNTYLALAVNQDHYGNVGHQSTIYQWHARSKQFIHIQDIDTNGALDFEAFEINRDRFLAVANSIDDSGLSEIDSVIYKYDHDQRNFRLYQRIITNGAIDLEYFSLGFEHYLIVTNYHGGNSVIYKWDGLNFVEFQVIPSILPTGWHSISVGNCGEAVLLVEATHEPNEDNVHLYSFSGSDKAFIKINETVDVDGWDRCSGFTSFTLEGNMYLVKTNENGGLNDYIDRIDVKIEDLPNPIAVQYQRLLREIEQVKRKLNDYESAVERAQGLLDDGMRLDGEQTITGHKIFTKNVTMENYLFGNTVLVEDDLNVDNAVETVDIGSDISTEFLLAELQSQSVEMTRIEAVLQDAVTLDSNQDITGRKIITRLTVEGAVTAQNLKVSDINGVDLDKLNGEAVRLNDQRAILGEQMFTQDVTVHGNVEMQPEMVINGVDLSTDIIFTDLDQRTISGVKQFAESANTVIEGNADFFDSATVSGIQISEEVVSLHSHNVITGHKVFDSVEIAGDLIVNGRVDLVEISDLYDDTLQTRGDQTISGAKTFTQSLTVNGSFTVNGFVNGIDLSDVDQLAAKLHEDFTITGNTVFEDPVIIHGNLIVDGLIDGIDVSEDILRFSGDQEITGEKTFTSLLTLEGNADVGGLVDGVELSEVVTLTGEQNITGSILFENGMQSQGDIIVDGTVDGVKVSDLNRVVVTNSTNQIIPYDVIFSSPVVIDGKIIIKGTVNGLELDNLFEDAVLQNSHQTQTITGKKTFKNDVTIADGKGFINVEGLLNGRDYVSEFLMKYGDQNIMGIYNFLEGFTAERNIEVNGLVDGVDLDRLVSEMVNISADQSIAGHKTFTGNVGVKGSVDVSGTVDGVDLSQQVMMTNAQQIVTGNLMFDRVVMEEALTVDGNINITGKIDGVDLEEFDAERITLSTDQTIEGDFDFHDTVHVDGDIAVSGTVNEIQLVDLADTILSLTKDQTIIGKKTFTSTVYMNSDVVANALVDGVDLAKLKTDALYTGGRQTVTGRKEFADNVRIVNKLIVDGSIDGVDLEFLANDVVRNDQPQVITANKTFNDGFQVNGDITVIDTVNSIDISEQLFRKSTTQTITGSYTFPNVAVDGNVTVTGHVNSVDISILDISVVKINVEQTIIGDITFQKDVFVDDITIHGKVDGVNISELYANTPKVNMDGHLESNVIFEGPVQIEGDLNVNGLVNERDLSEFSDIVVTLDDDQDITGDKTFEDNIIVTNDVHFKNLTVLGVVDGVDFNQIVKDAIYLDSHEPNTFTGENTFSSMNITGNIVSSGMIDGVRVDEQVVTLDGMEDISAKKTFDNDVHMNANLIILGEVNGIDISELAANILTISGYQEITGTKRFSKDVKMSSDLNVDGTVDGIDLSRDACTLHTAQNIRAKKTFTSLTIIDGDITVEGTVSGYDINELDTHRIKLDRDATLNGFIEFVDDVTFNGQVTVKGKVDEVDLEAFYQYNTKMSDQIRAELYEIAYIADQQCDIMEDLGDFYEGAIADFDYMEMYQILDIAEPRYIEAFEMNGKPYLATTSYKDNSGDLCTKSTIYVLNDDNTRFEERWNLFTNGATRWHALTVKGVQHLIIANHGQQRCSDATNYVSYVYKYDASTDDFIKVQEIETYSAMDVDSAVINGEIYLAVANTESQPASSNDAEGFIFKYISTAKQFALEQRLTTGSVSIVEFVKINNKHFVVFAQGESADQGTIIYQFNNGSFQPFQDLETSHAKDISHFLSDDTTILVITEEQTLGQYDNILSYEVAVKFYEWSANSENFLQYEQVAVTAPSAVKVFQIGAFYYLGVVSSFEDQFTLYKYIGSSGWTEELLLNVDNVFGIETFEYDGETYIVLVTDTNAVIYHALKLGGNVSVNPELCDHDLLDQSWHDKALLP